MSSFSSKLCHFVAEVNILESYGLDRGLTYNNLVFTCGFFCTKHLKDVMYKQTFAIGT